MKANYFLGLDVAKQKVRAALRGAGGRLLWEKDLPALWPAPCRGRPPSGLHGQRPAAQRKRAMEGPNQNEQARGGTLTHRLVPSRLQRRAARPRATALLPAQTRPRQMPRAGLSHLMRILTRRLVAVLRSQQPYRPKQLLCKNAA
jgi:hypothetical protein